MGRQYLMRRHCLMGSEDKVGIFNGKTNSMSFWKVFRVNDLLVLCPVF